MTDKPKPPDQRPDPIQQMYRNRIRTQDIEDLIRQRHDPKPDTHEDQPQ